METDRNATSSFDYSMKMIMIMMNGRRRLWSWLKINSSHLPRKRNNRSRIQIFHCLWVFLTSIQWIGQARASMYVDEVYKTNRCNHLSTSEECKQYERCRQTHRCARADEEYTIEEASIEFFDRKFQGGQRTGIQIMNDFENWKTGTHGWKSSEARSDPVVETVGISTFDFSVIGILELSSGHLLINTDEASMTGDVNVQGVISTTSQGTSLAVFNFMSVYLGKDVKIELQGKRALSIMSRSSMIVNTKIEAPPGTLGGFPGGGYPGENNINGPGSSSVRVYVKTIETKATNIDEVQQIETSVDSGQSMKGHFVVHYRGDSTPSIPYDVEPMDLERIMETSLTRIGDIEVYSLAPIGNPSVGQKWEVKFLTAVGNIPQLDVSNHLTGMGASIVTRTVTEGNSISGVFKLQFMGKESREIAHDISAEDMVTLLKEDFSGILTAHVTRTDPYNNCLQGSTISSGTSSSSVYGNYDVPNGPPPPQSYASYDKRLCQSGRGEAGGLIWKLEITTLLGNISPSSPTSPLVNASSSHEVMTATYTRQVELFDPVLLRLVLRTEPTLLGVGAYVQVYNSLGFSLSYGGGGGSFGGVGGQGYGEPKTATYLGPRITDLLGGSGGAAGGGPNAIDVLPFVRPIQGGGGGGAIYLYAENDLVVGEEGSIVVSGSEGESGKEAAGGGSGGTILVIAGGSVTHLGRLEANGGRGGGGGDNDPSRRGRVGHLGGGGGGGGGRLGVYAASLTTFAGQSVLQARGGAALVSPGRDGTVHLGAPPGLSVRVDPMLGAARTSKSLMVVGGSQPTRASYFVRISDLKWEGVENNRGAIFGLHDDDRMDSILIGVGMVDGWFTHGANFYDFPQKQMQVKVQLRRWYKIDIFVDWARHEYSVRINDITKVRRASFIGDVARSLGLYNYHPMTTHWDEIYVGNDYTMGFACPESASDKVLLEARSRRLWPNPVVGQESTYHSITRDLNHVSKRELYNYDNGGIIPEDGEPHIQYLNDIKIDVNDPRIEEDTIGSGEMLIVHDHQDSTIILPSDLEMDEGFPTNEAQEQIFHTIDPAGGSAKKATYYWYSEVYQGASNGGIGACSTTDYLTWRNEGIMIYFLNLTDPFGDNLEGSLIAERPKVVYNSRTSEFVMWLHIDNRLNEMGLSGVARSLFPNGPFRLHRSFYPDAPKEAPGGMSINETHDQTILLQKDGTAYLIRSYFKTVNFWLPRSVRDPLWESIKNPDGSTNFGLSYHRAVFHPDYDNVDDIYLQRWRSEDRAWEIQCCDEEDDPNTCTSNFVIPKTMEDRPCPEGKHKKIIGQGIRPVETRYKDPHDPANSIPPDRAVPSHTTWGQQVYDIKTWRGSYFDALSANITLLVFQRYAGETERIYVEENSLPYQYPNSYESARYINTSHTEVMHLLLSNLGVPVSDAMRVKYSIYDLRELDANMDGKVTGSEVSGIKSNEDIKDDLRTSLLSDLEELKVLELQRLDADGDERVTFGEFDAWIGKDPDVVFSRYDLDKSGYLDENELARILMDRQLPRLDIIMILMDPNFDGKVYFNRFEELIYTIPAFIYEKYDQDRSYSLNAGEIEKLKSDVGTSKFGGINIFDGLAANESISWKDYETWFGTKTSLIRSSRDALKADNAIHSTRPDLLTGPLHVVQTRRAKYVGVSQLTEDYLETKGLLTEIEGDFEGHDALINVLRFSDQLFNLRPTSDAPTAVPYRLFVPADELRHRARYWNGREWEGRPNAPLRFQYGQQCYNIAGTTTGCPPCLDHSPYVTEKVREYQSVASDKNHCDPDKVMDAYIKLFDQQVSLPLRYQQGASFGTQGLQPHYSPCINQTQQFMCDVHKVYEGNVGSVNDPDTTPWNLAWERHPNNVGSSKKIRAHDTNNLFHGPFFDERFPHRDRAPNDGGTTPVDQLPDQFDSILGGG